MNIIGNGRVFLVDDDGRPMEIGRTDVDAEIVFTEEHKDPALFIRLVSDTQLDPWPEYDLIDGFTDDEFQQMESAIELYRTPAD